MFRRGDLDEEGLADLAEARWRTGDIDAAAAAAAEHLALGGTRPISLVIAAEAAAVTGRPGEAEAHVAALRGATAGTLDELFAGIPRHAVWPAAAGSPGGTPDAPIGPEPDARAARRAPARPVSISDELSRAREELGSTVPGAAARGVARLALVLHQDPALAPAVLKALEHRRDAAALLVRGDAYRLLGRHLEAEAALAAAGRALDAPDEDRTA